MKFLPFVLDKVLLPVRKPQVSLVIHASNITRPYPAIIIWEGFSVCFGITFVAPVVFVE